MFAEYGFYWYFGQVCIPGYLICHLQLDACIDKGLRDNLLTCSAGPAVSLY